MSSEAPLVSAIMPTRGRREWASDALRMFREQTWPAKELVIIDDKLDRSFVNGCHGPDIRYYVEPRLNVGMKRNLAISRCNGPIVMHWDSDDIYTPDRMEHEVTMLLSREVDIVGYHEMEFQDVAGPRYLYRANARYVIGVSQTYWRDTWEARPFDPVDSGEDNAFLQGRRVYCEPAAGRIIARMHQGNTADKRKWVKLAPAQWERLP